MAARVLIALLVIEADWCLLRSDIRGMLITLAAVLTLAIVTD